MYVQKKFNLGDKVEWKQAGHRKVGVVVDIIPPNTRVNTLKWRALRNVGDAREVESYVVAGTRNSKTGVEINTVFWPLPQFMQLIPDDGTGPLRFHYVNHRGEAKLRTVTVKGMRFGTSEHYPEPQWLLIGEDHDRGALREFAVARMAPPNAEQNTNNAEA